MTRTHFMTRGEMLGEQQQSKYLPSQPLQQGLLCPEEPVKEGSEHPAGPSF